MSGGTPTLRVFISSTCSDLAPFREAAKEVVLKMGWHPVMMEHWGAQPRPTVEECRRQVQSCQLVVMLVGWRRGGVPPVAQGGDGDSSYTALELASARDGHVDLIAFRSADMWLRQEMDEGEDGAWVSRFRDGLGVPAETFSHPSQDPGLRDFSTGLRQALLQHKERLTARQGHGPEVARHMARVGRMLQGGCTVFAGCGIQGDGPLGHSALVRALGGGTEDSDEHCLAAAAEFSERSCGGRDPFLRQLRRILVEQAQGSPPPSAYGLIRECLEEATGQGDLGRPVLVISTAWDLSLEAELASLQPVIITHVMRSEDGEHDGKVLVLRPGQEPELCWSDGVDVRRERCVIYKPLGSPLLHERVDPELELDTVVATESDHLRLLKRLDNPRTGIPTAFTRTLRKSPLLFLGYPQDFWHYRLLAQVFEKFGRRNAETSVVSVRSPRNAMEELAWQRIHAALVRVNLDEMVEELSGSLVPPTEESGPWP